MREIKFRAKLDKESFPNSYNKGWVYGFVSKYEGDWCIDTYGNDGSFVSDNQFLQIDGETIGQFTGLHDKNGKEIYEGDVLLFNNDHPNAKKMDWKCVVKYRKGSFVCEYPKDGVYNHFDVWNVPIVTWEVIGNIYENPELLEGSTCNS